MSNAAPAARFDPRRTITPESFSVAPHLLGLPLASPSRRFLAIALDLVLCAILANVGGSVLFALACAVAFIWFAGRKLGKGGNFFSSAARFGLRAVGALFLFGAAISLYHRAQRGVEEVVADSGDTSGATQASVTGSGGHPSPLAAVRMVAELAAVQSASDSAHAFPAAHNAVRHMRRNGMSDAQIREALNDAVGDSDKPFVAAALRAALPPAPPAGSDTLSSNPDTLATRYAAAVAGGDSATANQLRPKLASVLARDSLDELRGQVSSLQSDKRELEQEKERNEKRGLLGTLLSWLNDLGIGFGWTGLYFTAFTALWRGQTPGKKLLGIRVLRLDGLPMTLWASFERFGGYAAGLFTGLMGYAQVYWDRNRQAIQDKISETVVIRHHLGVVLPEAPSRSFLSPRPAHPVARAPVVPPAAPAGPTPPLHP
jgi:uncharacterized RDD family membrane protein YckC